MTSSRFRKLIWNYYKEHGRNDLPWRKTTDPYRILVSEVMLQQTQVPRVIPKYNSFIKKFPTIRSLARAKFSDVLKEWSGLGYNRRAKHLHDAAKYIVENYNGTIPRDFEALRSIPGIGDYTANAIRVFAFNEPGTLVETNVRTAIIHHFLPHVPKIDDRTILVYVQRVAKGQDSREWNSALFDYGAHLKRSGVRNNAKSARYTKQSKFEGSLRQVRGAILRELGRGPTSAIAIAKSGRGRTSTTRFEGALEGLARDGLIKKEKGKWRIA